MPTGAHPNTYLQEPATNPYSCLGVFTDRSIFSLKLSRIQIPTGTSVTNCNHKHGPMLTWPHDVHMFAWGRVGPHNHYRSVCSCRLELAYFAAKNWREMRNAESPPIKADSGIFKGKCFETKWRMKNY